MYDYLVHLFSKSNSKKAMVDAISRNAVIVDVREPEQFETGHNKNAVNIPVNKFLENILSLKSRNKPVVVCGNGPFQSAKVLTIVKAAGMEGYNAGNWKNLSKI